MAPGDAICPATLGELGGGIGPRGVEQPIVGKFVNDGRGYQALYNQACDRVDNVRFVCLRLRRNRAGGLAREVPDKDRQPAQHYLLALRKQAVTPVEHRGQRLVPRQRGATIGASISVSAAPWPLAAARSMKSWAAGYLSTSMAVEPTSSGGQSSEHNRWTCSPSTRSASRLVARTCACGVSLTTRSASAAATPITCSQLSSTSRIFLSPIKASKPTTGSWVCTINPSTDAIAVGTSLASVSAARSMKNTAPWNPSTSA